MSNQILSFQRKDKIALINMIGDVDQTEKMVRLSDELFDICSEITWDEKICAVIVMGAGTKFFSIESNAIGPLLMVKEVKQTKLWSIAELIAKLGQPMITAINGDAIGQGLELALACDIRIATKTSYFGLPHIRSGLIPWDGGTQRLARLVGRGKALEMILTGETIDAQEAHRIGLIDKVVPPKELMEVAMKMAQEMASKGPIALRYAKEAIYKGMDMTLEQGLRLEADLYLLLHTTKDRSEGIKAFQEKRTPKFEGK